MWGDAGLGALVLGSYLVSRKRYRDVFTPLFVYVASWCMCLFLFRLRLVNYEELETGTILVISMSMAAFVAGCLFAGKPRRPRWAGLSVAAPSLEKVIRFLTFINILGLLFFVLRIARTFGIAAYISDPTVIRVDYEDLGRIGALTLLLSVDYPVFFLSLVHVLASRKLQLVSAVGLCLPAIQGYLTMSRNALAIPLATGMFAWFYYRGWTTLNRKIFWRAGLGLVLIAAYFVGVGLWYGKLATSEGRSYKQADFNLSSQLALRLIDPYMYATGDFPTFQAAMSDVHKPLWGVRTFFPIARLLYAVGLLHDRPENANLDFYFIPIPFNTGTYLLSLYEDFGMAGVLVIPFALGWLATKSYMQMKARPTLFSLGSSAALMVVIMYSVFIWLASTFLVWYYLLILFVVSRTCADKPVVAVAISKSSAFPAEHPA